MSFIFKLLVVVAALVLIAFELLMSLVIGITGAAQNGGDGAGGGGCQESTPTPPAIPGNSSSCFSSSPYSAQVVIWAEEMADALTVNPTCHLRAQNQDQSESQSTAVDCQRYTFYTTAFPQAVIAYGQTWCSVHGDCASWANGNYQCVSFVRGAYSQVYPMNLTNDAFNLWLTYQQQPGWQEIPAAATSEVRERGMPEPGDVMIFRDSGVGHAAIVIAVVAPHAGTNGEVTFANANSTSPYDHMPLLPNLLVDTTAWDQANDPQHSNTYMVWGYLRPKANNALNSHPLSLIVPFMSLNAILADSLGERKGFFYVAF